MKRFVIAILMLTVVIAGSFYVNNSAEKAIEETKKTLLSCCEKEKDTTLDIMKVKTAVKTWEKNRKILYMFMYHEDFSETENNMIKLELLSEKYDFEKISEISRESAMLLDNLKEEFRIKAENIL